MHYAPEECENVWTSVQLKYSDYLKDWRTDLGCSKNFHNGKGGTYDCIAIMTYYSVCKDKTTFREIEEIEEVLVLPSFKKLTLPPLKKEFQQRVFFEFSSIEDHYKYRADVMKTYPYAHYPVFEGYNHMQYQILSSEDFAKTLDFIIENNAMPRLAFMKDEK